MVPAVTSSLAASLFEPAIERAAAAHGLKTVAYYTTGQRRDDKTVMLGGNAPGIARNAFGLMGAISLLLETRGVGIGTESYQRRVATHYIAIKAVLETAAAHARTLKAATTAARRDIETSRADLTIGHTVAATPVSVPLIDAATGEPRAADTTLNDSRRITVTLRRPRPAGYLLLTDAAPLARDIKLFGAAICVLKAATDVDVEMFEIRDRAPVDRRAINPDASLKAVMTARRVSVPAGALYIPMAHAASLRIAAALEPDAPGSMLALDAIQVQPGTATAPVLRVPDSPRFELRALDGTAAGDCATPTR